MVDYSTAGAFPLSFVRYYNSGEQRQSLVGIGWRSNYDRSLYNYGGSVRVFRPDGKVLPYTWNGAAWVGQSDIPDRLVQTSNGWEFTSGEDVRETYDSAGRLLTIEERNGYTWTLAYDANGKLSSVTDPFGRQLTFTIGANGLIETMTVPGGDVYTYRYRKLLPHNTAASGLLLERIVYPDDTPSVFDDNPSLIYHYEENAELLTALVGITDENGVRFATWAYDSDGNAVLSEHAGGAERTTIAYNADGSRTVTNALGKQATYHFATIAGGPKLTRIEGHASANCVADSVAFTYDANGYLASSTGREGTVTLYQHDARGLEVSRTEAAGTPEERTITTDWHATLRVPTRIVEPGRTTDLVYDAQGRLIAKTLTDTTGHTAPYSTAGQTRTWAYTWTAAGLLESVDGPLTGPADTTQFSYDVSGRPTKVTNALGHETDITTHNGRGQPTTIVDANGVATVMAYDPRGRLLSTTVDPGPTEAVTTMAYDPVGNITRITLPDGAKITYEYDAARRLTAISNSLGERIEYTLDAMGNRTQEAVKATDGTLQRSRTWVYDELGRLLRAIGAEAQATAYAYDRNGNLISVTDPLNRVTQRAFDPLNRLIQETDPLLGLADYAYDVAGNLAGVTDPLGNETRYVYDGFGNRIQTDSPDTGITVYDYDAAGNMVEKTDARGVVTQYTHDLLDRVTAKTFPSDPTQNVIYTYDDTLQSNHAIGRLTSIDDAAATTTFDHDARGNIVRESRTINGVPYGTEYAFDGANRVVSITYPSGRIVAFHRDDAGRVTSVLTRADAAAPDFVLASSIEYAPFGPVSAYVFGNGLKVSIAYDQDGRVTAIDTARPGQSAQSLSYLYDSAGNIVSLADNVAPSRSQSFTYDDLDRLIQGGGPYGTIDYTYDAVGNRTSRTISDGVGALLETYSYDAFSSRLLSLAPSSGATRSFTYSASGQATSDDGAPGGPSVFGYDASDRLTSVQQGGATAATYGYNAFGQRVVKSSLGATTHVHYDRDGRRIAETDDLGQAEREYVYLDDLPLALIEPGRSGPVAADVTVDNEDAGADGTGWTPRTDAFGYYGLDYAARDGGTGTSNFDWLPTLPWTGQYQVYARWPEMAENEGSTAHYTVTHADGTTAVSVDQRAGGDRWNLLGTFPLTAGAGHGVSLSDEADPGVVTNAGGPDAAADFVVDNTDPSTVAVGAWSSQAVEPGFYGANVQYRAAGTGANTFTWPVPIVKAGRYKIYARWNAHSNRANNAPFTIHHAGGATTLRINQEVNGGIWILLGAYDLAPGTGHRVVLSDDANEYVIADAIRFVYDAAPTGAEEMVVDNSDPQVTAIGGWTAEAQPDYPGYYGRDLHFRPAGTGTSTFTWPAPITTAGRYKVYTRWNAHANRANNAPYTVHHSGGATTLPVSQEGNGGSWVLLGSYDFAPGANHRIVLSDDANEYVIADAVRFVPDTDPAGMAEIIIDDGDPAVIGSGSWIANTYVTNHNGDHHYAAAGGGGDTHTWPAAVPQAGRYKVYTRWHSHPNRATNAPYTIHHADGRTTVRVNQEINGDLWYLLGSYDIAPGANHRVVLTDDANEYVIADAVRFVPDDTPITVVPRTVAADAVRFVANSAEDPRFVHADHLGTPQAMTDQAGALIWDRVARPFGETHALTGIAANPQRFPGQYLDPETGYHYNYFRDYDPTTGRYLQSDPIGLDGGLNTYAYVGGNPVSRSDPTGEVGQAAAALCFIPGVGMVSCAAAAAAGAALICALNPQQCAQVAQMCYSALRSGFGGGDEEREPDGHCQEHFVRCLNTSLEDEPGSVYGQTRCGFCREVCVREGGWPSQAPTTSGWARCDYWKF